MRQETEKTTEPGDTEREKTYSQIELENIGLRSLNLGTSGLKVAYEPPSMAGGREANMSTRPQAVFGHSPQVEPPPMNR
ncbi:hypothetical protein J6590_073705 [Homalodisca vitripennis]|nr:hypothetical protein J6590_073705 [Homalodisca vitripennis]